MYDLMPILTKWVDYLDSASTLTNRPSETDLLLITGSKGRRRLIPMYLKRGKPNFMVVPKGRKTRFFFVSCFSFSFNLFGNVWSLYAMLGYIDCCCNLHLFFFFFSPWWFLFLSTVIDFKVIQFFFRASVDDVIGTLLSLYMHDSSQSLPTAEEVLICTPDTTTEEVSCWLKLFKKARNVVF